MRVVVLNELLDLSNSSTPSRAKLNLPVQLSTEPPAIRWRRLVDMWLDSNVDRGFNKQVADLEECCQNWFSAAGEIVDVKSECQPVKRPSQVHHDRRGANVDRLQHIEVIQGTTATDSASEISSAAGPHAAGIETRSIRQKVETEAVMKGRHGGRGAH